MENYLSRITINPEQLDGKPCIRSLRISVQTILEFLSAGDSHDNILLHYPLLAKEDIYACLQYAAKISGKEIHYQPLNNHA
jgi:uncharacterized protein (DUF433 family)